MNKALCLLGGLYWFILWTLQYRISEHDLVNKLSPSELLLFDSTSYWKVHESMQWKNYWTIPFKIWLLINVIKYSNLSLFLLISWLLINCNRVIVLYKWLQSNHFYMTYFKFFWLPYLFALPNTNLINIQQMSWQTDTLNHGQTIHPTEYFISLNLFKIH